jgi:2-polyprenyl-6-methoxyphenol hydroxylase-like FAD-dependent oxidoreductase
MSDVDVIVVGAGPAGTVAATVLARAGVRVRLLDRATFPRDKLCGDTVNPGTLALLRRLRMADGLEAEGLRIDGMIVTGARGELIDGRYPQGLHGVSCARRDLDWRLLQDAVKAGAAFDEGVAVRAAVVREDRGRPQVEGVRVGTNGSARAVTAPVVIAADGRRSTIAFALGLARQPAAPTRWAVGAYYASPAPPNGFGEMHIRPGRYIGVAPTSSVFPRRTPLTRMRTPGSSSGVRPLPKSSASMVLSSTSSIGSLVPVPSSRFSTWRMT